MQNLFLVALTALFFCTSCKNEPAPAANTGAVSIPVKAADVESQAQVPPPQAASDDMATLAKNDADTRALPTAKNNEKQATKPQPSTTPTVAQKPAEQKATSITEVTKPIAAPPRPEPQTAEKQPVAQKPTPGPTVEKPAPPSHATWDELLKKYVTSSGSVDYVGIKSEAGKLDAYLEILRSNPPQNDWARGDKLAFWINAYNAFTVKLITDNYPLSSITKLDGGKPWDRKWIKIGDKTYSLNNIENDIIRPTFKEPRIHFAVNCAAKSCPPLLNRAWTATNLESNLEKQAKAFINNPAFNAVGGKKAAVSKIFEWYAADFGDLVTYLNKYAATKIDAGTKPTFKEYDWGLNK